MEELFNNIYKQIEEYDEKNPQPIERDYSDQYELFMSSDKFLNYIWMICKTQPDDIIYSTLAFNYDRILSLYEEGSYNDKEKVGELLAYPKFLIGLIKVFAENQPLSDTDVQRASKMYISAIQHYHDLANIYPLYFALAKVSNARMITLLKEILPEESAVLVAASSNVAYDLSISVSYVNYALMCINEHTPLAEQNIAKIYSILIDNNFDRLRGYFVYTLTDQCPNNALYYTIEAVTEFNEKCVYAICSIVENLPSYQIGLIVNAAMITPSNSCYYYNDPLNIPQSSMSTILGLNMFGTSFVNIIKRFPRIVAACNYIKANSHSKW